MISVLLCTTAAFAQKTVDYEYDDLNRLVSVIYGNGTSVTYQYDILGNRTAKIINAENDPPTISDIPNQQTETVRFTENLHREVLCKIYISRTD